MNQDKFIIIAPLSSISKRVRLFKIVKFLHHSGVKDFTHIAWERLEGESVETEFDFDINKRIILKGGGYGGQKVKAMYLLWMLKVFFHSFSIQKGDKVWALGFESAFPLLLASKIKKFDVYFDDADRFSMLFHFPAIFLYIVEKLEILTSRNVFKHIIPVKERYNFESDNFFLLMNTPSKTEIDAARTIFQEREWVKAAIVININGWLGNGRGMKTALKLSQHLEKEDVKFIVAGKVDCDEAKLLVERKNVQYLGKISNAEALASYFASDFVFTYYDPRNVINTLAASNKWGDAIKTGIGIIVNKEVKTASFAIKNSLTLSYNYNDHIGLIDAIKEICSHPHLIEQIKNKTEDSSDSVLYFEDQLKILFNNETK